MDNNITKLMETLRKKQLEMQPEYDRHITMGKLVEIPWEGHKPVRVLVNRPISQGEEKIPFMINLHGGGFIEGDALTMDSYCQKLADELGIIIFNVNYRLCPDYLFPYPVEETDRVYRFILAHQEELGVCGSRGAIGGFSAGATIALGAAYKALSRGDAGYKCCVLGYPLTSASDDDLDNACGYPTVGEEMLSAMHVYYNNCEKDPVCSPILAEEELLSRLQGVIAFTCGKDSLGKQGELFVEKVMRCGVPVLFKRYSDGLHGFIEVNRPDYFLPDDRKTPRQQILTDDAEAFIIDGLTIML